MSYKYILLALGLASAAMVLGGLLGNIKLPFPAEREKGAELIKLPERTFFTGVLFLVLFFGGACFSASRGRVGAVIMFSVIALLGALAVWSYIAIFVSYTDTERRRVVVARDICFRIHYAPIANVKSVRSMGRYVFVHIDSARIILDNDTVGGRALADVCATELAEKTQAELTGGAFDDRAACGRVLHPVKCAVGFVAAVAVLVTVYIAIYIACAAPYGEKERLSYELQFSSVETVENGDIFIYATSEDVEFVSTVPLVIRGGDKYPECVSLISEIIENGAVIHVECVYFRKDITPRYEVISAVGTDGVAVVSEAETLAVRRQSVSKPLSVVLVMIVLVCAYLVLFVLAVRYADRYPRAARIVTLGQVECRSALQRRG